MAAFAVALVTCWVFCEQAQAVPILSGSGGPIPGGISLAEGYTANLGNLNTATSGVFVTSVSGSYGGAAPEQSMTMNGTFNPFVVPVAPDILTVNQDGDPFSSKTTRTGAGVPEGGSALALLGIGLVAIEALRRRKLAAA